MTFLKDVYLLQVRKKDIIASDNLLFSISSSSEPYVERCAFRISTPWEANTACSPWYCRNCAPCASGELATRSSNVTALHSMSSRLPALMFRVSNNSLMIRPSSSRSNCLMGTLVMACITAVLTESSGTMSKPNKMVSRFCLFIISLTLSMRLLRASGSEFGSRPCSASMKNSINPIMAMKASTHIGSRKCSKEGGSFVSGGGNPFLRAICRCALSHKPAYLSPPK
mmetsp:Transcript_21913/g.50032  ORF Transcript_21913/g.50032 Transcript_21913/m.50032 type:complete len:226 (-) Transcript_21913:2451-3128(-)